MVTEFQQALDDLKVAEKALRDCPQTFEGMAIESSFEEALKTAYRKAKPRAKFSREKAFKVLGPGFDEIRARFKAEADAYYDGCKAPVTELKDRVEVLAKGYPLESGPQWRELSRHYEHTYSSTGSQYARGRARITVDGVECLGLVARIVSGEHQSWVVEVQATQLSIEALKRRDLLTVREFLKACWSKALNPRVYNPYLPHGLEQKLGVTWQGRDVEGWRDGEGSQEHSV